MKGENKHREVSRQLLSDIAAGKYGVSGRLPGEEQLVKRFGVSRTTIGRALRDLQVEGIVERRAGSGTYVRKQGANASGTRQLGLLIPELATIEIFALICGELASVVRSHDYTLLWGDSAQQYYGRDLNPEQAAELCEQFIERRVCGVFLAPFEGGTAKNDINRSIAQRLSNAGIPIVLLDRDTTAFPQRSEFDLIASDNNAGGRLLTEHLLKLGCQRLAFVARANFPSTVEARISGVRDALLRHHQELPEDWIHIGDPEDMKFVRSIIAGRRWDALVCGNDLTAAQLMRGLEKSNTRVPRDIRVVGFDDVKYATLLSVPLTTVHQSARDIAVTAYRAILDRIAEPTLPARTILLTPRLVVRESCGAYLPRKSK
jgi:DNA-binding LacI/PurR family transcriptional regulator